MVPDHKSVDWYRMKKTSLEVLLQRIGHHLLPAANKNNPIPPETIILSSLRFLAGGALQDDVVLGHGLSQPSFSKHFARFLDAVIEEMQDYLGWYSTQAEAQEAKEEFFKKSHIPGIMGIIGRFMFVTG